MKKLLLAAAFACIPLLALAQGYPSPTFNTVTLQNPLGFSGGGTGATTASGALANLGAVAATNGTLTNPTINGSAVGTMASQNANNVAITSGSVTGLTTFSATTVTAPTIDIPEANGAASITLTNDGNNQIALPANAGFQLNGGGSVQFGGSVGGGLLANDGAPNDVVEDGNTVGDDVDFVLYPGPSAGAWLVVNKVGGANQEQIILGTNPAQTGYALTQNIAGAGQYLPIQFNGGSTDAMSLTTTGNAQFDNIISANSPGLKTVGLTSCGTNASGGSANNVRGILAIGSGAVTACTVTFSTQNPYKTTPVCVLTGVGTGSDVLSVYAPSASGFTIESSATMGGDYVNFHCME